MTHLSDDTLVALVDGELGRADAADARAHLDECGECAARLARFGHVSRALNEGLRRRRRRAVRVAVAVAATAVCVCALGSSHSSPFPRLSAAELRRPLPVRYLTPGVVRPVSSADVCAADPELEPPAIPADVRRMVLRSYGAADLPEREYELDYLITPALGGAADPRNLWPERYASPTWNARVKDELEDLLHRMVCSGALSLSAAQRDMAGDWIAAYKRYFHTERPGGWISGLPRPALRVE